MNDEKNDRDQELQSLLSRANNINPTPKQIEQWKEAVSREATRHRFTKPNRLSWVGQLAAALATGFIIGFYFSHHPTNLETAKSEPNATVEYVFAKSE